MFAAGILLEHGAEMEARDYCDQTLLHAAVRQALAEVSKDEFEIRLQRLAVWKEKGQSFQYGYLKRCELCRAQVVTKGIKHTSGDRVS